MVESSILSSAWTSFFAFFLHLYHPPVVSRPKSAPSGPAEGSRVLGRGAGARYMLRGRPGGLASPNLSPDAQVRLEKAQRSHSANRDVGGPANTTSPPRRRNAGYQVLSPPASRDRRAS